MHARQRLTLIALCALTSAPLRAHDFWIEPANFQPKAGVVVPVHLRVGELGRGEAVERLAERILRFTAVDVAGARDVPGREGADPAGLLRTHAAGLIAIGYESDTRSLELPPERFEAYLREEGLDALIAERAARGEGASPSRELYSRSAKSLVRVDGAGAGPGPVLGLPLEFVPIGDPFAGQAGRRALELELRFEGRPLAGVLVELLALDAPPHDHADGEHAHAAAGRARSDAAGRVRFELPAAGRWLATGVHMQRAQADSGADWRSWWASLSLAVP